MTNPAQAQNSKPKLNTTFTAIPQNLINSTTWQNLSGNAIKVYITLRSYSNGEYKPCWPGINRLIQHTGLSRNTLIKCLKELEIYNLIEIVQTHNRTNLYQFKLDYDKSKIFQKEDQSSQLKIPDFEESNFENQMSNSEQEMSKFDNKIQILNSNKKQEQETRTTNKQQDNSINKNNNNDNVVVVVDVNDDSKTNHEIVKIEEEVKSRLDIDKVKSFSKKTGIQYHILIWLLYKYKISSERLNILEIALDSEKYRIKNKGGFIRRAIEEDWPFQEISNELNRKQKAKEDKLKQKRKIKQEQIKEVERKKKNEQIDKHQNDVLSKFQIEYPKKYKEFKQEIQKDIFNSLGLQEGILFEKICNGRLYEKACTILEIAQRKE